MGVYIIEEKGFIICETGGLKGVRLDLDFPSVGATENIMIAAVLAEGRTIIENAAREPEIVDLQNFLNKMGAKITGAGTNAITIEGVDRLNDVEYTVCPDRIEAGTYLAAAAAAKGDVLIKDIVPEHLYPVTSKLAEAGCEFKFYKDMIHIKAPEILRSVSVIKTLPYPGFPTDMQPQLTSLLSISQGTSVIIETIFESRNKHIGELVRMGADIICEDGRTSIIKGVKKLTGAAVRAKDLRGGAALIIAGLSAEGETVVTDSEHVERGYENIEKVLSSVGADIKFINSGQ